MSILGFLGSSAGSGILQAGSSLLSNIFGSSNQNSANKTNMRIAQMNNEWSERMMQKQMDYNTEMWQKEADYNSAKAQVERLKEAGLNPALSLGSSNAGSVSSGNSVGLPSPSGTSVQAFRPDFSGIGNALANAFQLTMQRDKTNAEIDYMKAQSDVARARAAADNAWTYERLKETKIGRMFLEQTFDVRKQQINADYQNSLRQGRQMEENIKLTASQGLLASKELAIFDAQRAAGIANTIADTLLKTAQGRLTKQQAIHEVQKMYETAARAQGLKISNDVAKRSANAIVDKVYNEEYWSRSATGVVQAFSDWIRRK